MWDKRQPYPLDAVVRRFPATCVAQRRRERVVDAHVACTEEYITNAQSQAGDDEDVCIL